MKETIKSIGIYLHWINSDDIVVVVVVFCCMIPLQTLVNNLFSQYVKCFYESLSRRWPRTMTNGIFHSFFQHLIDFLRAWSQNIENFAIIILTTFAQILKILTNGICRFGISPKPSKKIFFSWPISVLNVHGLAVYVESPHLDGWHKIILCALNPSNVPHFFQYTF